VPAHRLSFRQFLRLISLASLTFLVTAAPAAASPGTAEWVLLEQASATGTRSLAKIEPKSRRQPPRRVARRSVPVAATSTAIVPNDPLWRDSWALAKTNAARAWSVTTGTSQTVVAVLDTGVDSSHPDLQGAFVDGYDTVNEDTDPSDDHGHGTMVAGVIAARANNGIGVAGTCWRCSLMPVKVIAANGSGTAADVAEGIQWASDHGADVINLSFTMSSGNDAVAAAIAHARTRGAVVVAAAGNTGSSEATFPAAYPGVISVTGTDPSDARYGWSSYGSWVRLAAPGCNVTTAPSAGYGDFCGTSSATAFVSGLAGLVRSYAPNLSPDAVAEALSAHAAPVGDFVSAGRVDAAAVLSSLKR